MSGRRPTVVAVVLCGVFSQAASFVPQTSLQATGRGDQQEAAPPSQPSDPPRPATPPPPGPRVLPDPPPPPAPAPPALSFPAAQELNIGQDAGGSDASTGPRKDDVVRIASDYALKVGDRVGDLVVVMGDATIDGHVLGELVVVLGEAQLGPEAVVAGDLVLIGGTLRVKPGAAARRDVVVVAGSLDAPADFTPRGQQVIIGFKGLGDAVRGLLPWLTRGLLLGRPIVPDLPWVWAVVGVLFAVYLGVLFVFEQPVRLAADTLTATPLRALMAGLGTMLAAGPLVLLLAASVVGLLVVPFVACVLLVAALVGKVAANAWLGARLVPEGGEQNRLTLARSFVTGCVVLILAYMVPVLGGVVWASVGAVGLGASVLAFVSAYRRENPPAAPASPVPPPVLFAPAGPAATREGAPAWSEYAAVPPIPAASASSQASILLTMPHAAFLDRLAAFALDVILVAMVILLMSGIDGQAFLPLLLAYRFAFWAWKGATVGGIVCQLRVIRVDGTLVGPGEAMVRSLGSIFSIGILGIGCLWILRDADRQAWHDKMAGTFVVKVPRQWPV